jgi:putative transposase
MPWNSDCSSHQRWSFIAQWLRRKIPLTQLCRRFSISRKTAYKWLARFEIHGRRGLDDRTRAAELVHNRPSRRWLERIRRWRARHPTWGAPKIRWALQRRFGASGVPSEAAISRWLKHWGLSRRRRRPVRRGPRVERPELTTAVRPNDVWSVDYKGWFRTGDGTRVEPLTVRDMASCYILATTLLANTNLALCRAAFTQIFRTHGLPAAIRVDNGTPFGSTGAWGLTRLSVWWIKLGIRVEFIEPGQPGQNAAHEQMHRVYKDEVLKPPAYTLSAQKRRTTRWRYTYNHERPHETLGMRVPAERYRKSRRLFPAKLSPWRYPRGWQSRLVKGKGMISLNGKRRYIGEAFEGERVGLHRHRSHQWDVYFGPLLLGQLHVHELAGIQATWLKRRKLPS